MRDRLDVPKLRLVHGGLFRHLERKLGWSDERTLSVGKRIWVFWFLTWVPIVILDLLRLLGPHAEALIFPLYDDSRMNIRLLFSAPLFILADQVIDRRLNHSIAAMRKRRLTERPESLDAIVLKANRQCTGTRAFMIEIFLLILSVGIAFYGTWKHSMGPLRESHSVSAIWYEWIALPLFHFLQLRWLWRFGIWTEFLWRLSKLKLRIVATHPDLAGGLSVLAFAQESFGLLWIGMSAGAAATVDFSVVNEGKSLDAYYVPIGIFVGIQAFTLLAPLMFFIPQLFLAHNKGLLKYGTFSSEYVRLFENKWISEETGGSGVEPLLGTSDIQSLADLGNGFERVRKMRIFPADKFSMIRIVLAGALPFIPLIFLVTRLQDVLRVAVSLFFQR
jgi:hypothetical protein